MTWLVAGAFIAMAAWILVPDKMDDRREFPGQVRPLHGHHCSSSSPGIGDKTQIATVLLAPSTTPLIRSDHRYHPRHDAGQRARGVARRKLGADKPPQGDPHCLRHPSLRAWHLHPIFA